MGLNETVNATVNATANATGSLLDKVPVNSTLVKAGSTLSVAGSFIPLVFLRLWDLITAPFHEGEMLWIIIPLLFSLLVMEFYFERNRDEELGWGAAVANSLVLIFVAIDLLKKSFHNATPWQVLKEIVLAVFSDASLPLEPQVLLLILFLGTLGLAVTLINYFHLLPRKMAFVVSGHPPINFLAYFAIAIVYSTGTEHAIPFDLATLVAGALLFILILLAVFGVKKGMARMTGSDSDRRSIWN